MKKTRIATILALVLVFVAATVGVVIAGCKKSTAKITLNYEEVQLYVNGKDETVRATLEPADNNATYEWTVDDESVVSIRPTQSICRISPLKEGTAKLTVTAGGATATCNITVGADQHVQLTAPSFTYDESTGKITITDTNATGVGSYRLDFYKEGESDPVGSVEVKNGEVVDTSRIDKGTYTVKLVAVGASELYYDSEPSTATATIVVSIDARYDLGSGDSSAQEKEDHWAYYVYDWCLTDVTEDYFYDGVLHFNFTNNVGAVGWDWICQLIYNYGKGQEGKLYKMVLDINTTMEGRVTLGDKIVTLHEGDNRVTVGINGADLFKIKFGVSGEKTTMTDAVITISIVDEIVQTETEQLKLPDSFSYDSETNIITIVDTQNSEYDVNYTLGFFENETDLSPKGTTVVKNGGEVDMTSVGTGTYFLRIMSATTGRPYSSSGWSEVGGQIGVVNNKVPIPNGGQAASASTPNKWYEWHATYAQSSGAETTVEEAYMDDEDNVYVTFSVDGGPIYQPLKLHYNDSAINQGDVYTFSCVITSEVEGYITVNGQIFELKAGTNKISVTRAQPDKNNGGGMRTTITIQFGAQLEDGDVMVQGSFVISETHLEKIDVTQLETPSFTYNSEEGKVEISDTNEATRVSGYEIGFFDSQTADTPMGTAVINEDGTFDSSAVGSGTYYLRIRALPAEVIYGISEWSEVGGQIGVVTERVDINSGTLGGANTTQNTWFYYKESVTVVEEAYLDEKNDIHVTFTAPGYASDQPLKLFFNKADINQGDVYTLTLTITSPVAGKITVNGKIFDISAGDTPITVTRAQLDKGGSDGSRATIVIQFGANATEGKSFVEGSFLIKDIELTKVDVIQLDPPSFTYSSDEQKVEITDTNEKERVSGYEIGFFESDSAADPMGRTTVNEDGTFDSSAIGSGTYYLRIRAIAADIIYATSEWSEIGGRIGVVTERVDIAAGNAATALSNQNTWYYYNGGATVGEDGIYLDENNDIHVSFTPTSNTDQPIKFMYFKADINDGDIYTLSLTVSSPNAGYITVNEQVFELHAGDDNYISVSRAQPQKTGSSSHKATITILMGAKVGGSNVPLNGTYVLKDITLTKVDVTPLSAPSFSYDEGTKTVTFTDGVNPEGSVKRYEIGLFSENGAEPVKTITVESGTVLDLSDVANGTYTLKIRAISDTVIYSDSEWTGGDTAITVTVEGAAE